LCSSSSSFSCPVPTPLLPSFPTRRSSDLALHFDRDVLQVRCLLRRQTHGAKLRRVQPRNHFRLDRLAADQLLQPRPNGPRRPHRDRKSTRLNSSHVSISYAVFCLKKKKNT